MSVYFFVLVGEKQPCGKLFLGWTKTYFWLSLVPGSYINFHYLQRECNIRSRQITHKVPAIFLRKPGMGSPSHVLQLG